ncbi:peroxiredoxin [Thermosynechococcaceae cyanobacterium BACA0444]|uniref:thioredoxin-dependent peroxiredoxin n=1 Tax=Pseudocalidococcus azoricus BACA0444 TaxID=2918990 RepID=A0AAE4FV68_9CYAN|nr:peroxiredoxin [Pseudocalidococcus azoricus]MDS3862463.1 peroxiredoxin [Pseudocalidococcus azoricus BACA0444]
MAKPIKVGDPVPDISLPDAQGEIIRLRDFQGKKAIVLFFYPKSESPGCTIEACAFRDAYGIFQDLGAEVIGISDDSVAAQARFTTNQKLPFLVLSDKGNQARQAFGVPGALFGFLPGRVTYVIDQGGIVRHIFDSMLNFKAHVDESLAILNGLASTAG